MTNDEVLAGFRSIFERWREELRVWDESRRSNEVLTFRDVVVDDDSHDHSDPAS